MTAGNIITLSIEPINGAVHQHPFHLGTDMKLAKTIAEERFARGDCKTVALIRSGRVEECFDGMWPDEYCTFED